jgi:hypothetical protein
VASSERVVERPVESAAESQAAADVCAEFNRQQAQALSPEEHMRTFGCPPCPCACVNGRVTCAPCAACGGFRESPTREKQVGPRQVDAGR